MNIILVNQSENATNGLDEGNYSYFSWVNDSNGNTNMTEIRYFRTSTPSGKKFAITNSSNDVVASIDDTGDLFLLGNIAQSQSSLTAEKKSFIVTNSTNDVVSYITNTGYLFLQGIIGTGSVSTGVAPTNLEIRNSTNDLVAFINNTGSLQIIGNYYDNYEEP